MQLKIWCVAPLLLITAACANQEAGRSQYWDTVATPATPETVAVQREVRPVTLNELQETIEGRDPSPLTGPTGDAALVASLNSAIERAGLGETVGPAAPVAPAAGPVVTTGIAAPAERPAQPGAEAETGTTAGTTEITDNTFATVVQTETIETDRAKLEALEGQHVELRAAPMPDRVANVNLAAFARSTSHKIGEQVFNRDRGRNRSAAQCQKYRNPDEAQRAFLANGGPDRDPLRMDPDGDGFVCGWSPIPFRTLQLPG